MADIFRFFVYDDRSIQFELAEPIMLEDTNVTEFKFRIPKSINGFDMTDWAWWFVYVNPSRQKYSVPLSFTDDEDEPEEYANATYTVDYGMSGTAGTVQFALEAINADATTDEILNEWHTKTYSTRVISTLQGNQTEFTQSEFDIISAKLEEIMEIIGGGGGGGSSKTSDDIENTSNVTGATVTDVLNALNELLAQKGTYSKPSGGIPKSDLASAVQTALDKASTALQSAPVTSVNGQTGAVELSSDDVANDSLVGGSTVADALNSLNMLKASKNTATTSANGLMSSTDKGRLDTLYADYSSAITALGV